MADAPKIPFCRSEFLQDISIELGRRFAGEHPFKFFNAKLDTEEHDGEVVEKLTVWVTTWHGTLANLTLWDDGSVWVGIILQAAENNADYKVGFYPRCEGFAPERIVETFRDTISVSTRLCYGETPLPTLRLIWKHEGKVQIVGELPKSRAAQSGAESKQ